MNRLFLPFAIFFSVLLVGTALDQFAISSSWKIGVLCLVAVAVQIAVTRFQRSRRGPHSR